VTLNDTGTIFVITGDDGSYSFTNIQNGSCTITPSKSQYTFSPQSITVTVNNSDVTGQDFIGTLVGPFDNWHLRNAPPNNFFSGISYSNGTFVTVGSIFLSSPDGVDWASRHEPENPFATTYKITYGAGIFVTAGTGGTTLFGSHGQIYTSANGVAWSDRTCRKANGAYCWGRLFDVTFGNGLFVAVGSGILTSPDGLNWTFGTLDYSEGIYSIAYGNGLFVAMGYDGSVLTSQNGIDWVISAKLTHTPSGNRGIAFGNGLFVTESNNAIVTSPDGIIWTARTSVDRQYVINDVAYGDGIFIAVGTRYVPAGGTFSYPVILFSYGGTAWTETSPISSVGNDVSFWGVAYGQGTFIVVGGPALILQSDPVLSRY
jgi:hypothetical protein